MFKGIAAAIALAGALVAGQASATTMLASMVGSYNDDPFWLTWKADLIYDTSLGTLTPLADGNKLTWSLADGGPSPLLSAHVVVSPRTVPHWSAGPCDPDYPNPMCDLPTSPVDVLVKDFTSFALTRTLDTYLWEATTATPFFMQIGVDAPWCGGVSWCGVVGPPGTDLSLDAPFDAPYLGYHGFYGSWNLNDPAGGSSSPWAESLTVSALAVPEPATWAMMLLGFFGIGAAVRRKRWPGLAAAHS